MHGVDIMRDALGRGGFIGKEVEDTLEARPEYGRYAHAAWFMGGKKDAGLCLWAALRCWRFLGPACYSKR